jgi:adenine deaminase
VVVDRHHGTGATGVGFVRGFGLRNGALAATTNCDNQNVVAVGTDDSQLAAAVAALDRLGGGYVVIGDGKVLAELPLPYAGIISDQPWEVVLEQSQAVNAAAAEIGCPIHAPFMILAFVGLPGVPDYGLTELGLIDVIERRQVGVVLEDYGDKPDCRCVHNGRT